MVLGRILGKKPSPAKRIEAELVAWATEVWSDKYYGPRRPEAELDESIHRLGQVLSPDELRDGAASLYFEPERWITTYNAHDLTRHAIVWVAEESLCLAPPADLVERVAARIDHLRARGHVTIEIPHHLPEYGTLDIALGDLPPDGDRLMGLLERAAANDLRGVGVVTDLALHGVGHGSRPHRLVPRCVLYLHRAGALDLDLFRRIAYANPQAIALLAPTMPQRWFSADDWPDELSRALSTELAQLPELDDIQARLLSTAEVPAGFLEDAVRLHATHGLGPFNKRGGYGLSPHHGAVRTLANSGPDDGDDLIDRLRAYPAGSLEALLPIAPGARRPLVQALGWEDAADLIDLLHDSAEVEASANPDIGAIDVARTHQAIDRAGPQLTKKVIATFKKAKFRPGLIKLLQATKGDHADWIRNSLPKRNQLAVRAMAAAPIVDGFDEVRARFEWIQQFRSEAKQFGSQRQGSERGAADAALFNLATNAGYADVTRLRLAVAASEPIPLPSWTIGEYEVGIDVVGARAHTSFRKGDKTLKTAPKQVKESAAYDAIKQARKVVHGEAAEFARMFESAMTIGDRFSPDEVTSLTTIPIAATVLGGLVVQDGAATTARLVGDSFVDAGGEPVELDGDVTVAHPIQLAEAGDLITWQGRVVADHIVQPFKQVFREHYPLTPVELEDGFVSARFAGHIIDTGKAAALFGAREWVLPQEEGGEVSKRFPAAGVTAIWELADVGHHLTETLSVGTGGIFFVEGPTWFGAERIPLSDVVDTVFSEVMRDADLVVSVAPGDPEGRAQYRDQHHMQWFSPQTLEVRRQLVAALVGNLDIDGVEVEGNFAHVTGRRASYRVHLGSGAIHIDPGNHLCIVPTSWGQRTKVFLPFADDDDHHISQIVSKVLLLSADHKIKDETILAQIDRARST